MENIFIGIPVLALNTKMYPCRIRSFTICWFLFLNFTWIESVSLVSNEVGQVILGGKQCSPWIGREISKYTPIVNKIFDAVKTGAFKGKTWGALATFVDKFGNRIAGSENLENAIDYMLNLSKINGLENVHGEDVSVPHWVRGKESATLIKPRIQNLAMLGLGSSIGTPKEGITGNAIVVKSFEELASKASLVNGKIVVYNEEFVSYGKTAVYRTKGATEAAKLGAIASLVRSITPFSINTPHTGIQEYGINVTKIPTAAITIEDAEMLQRMQDRGEEIIINLYMEAKNLENKVSRNTVVELKGSLHPEKVVVVSGHLDSWDVGTGAMDDGGGAFISWYTPLILKHLGLRPKRTVRAVLWTGEEEGLFGAFQYAKAHANETKNFMIFMESDEGTFTPRGLQFSGTSEGACVVKEILKLMEPINATDFELGDYVGSDIEVWRNIVPCISLLNNNDKYFWFHHTNGDTMTVEKSEPLDYALGLFAATSYVIADMSIDFPGFKNIRKSC